MSNCPAAREGYAHVLQTATVLMRFQSLTSVAPESSHVHEVFASVRRGAAMETTTAETGRTRPIAQVMILL